MFTKLRRFVIGSTLAVFMLPGLALAQDSKVPEFNPICWKEKPCNDLRAQAMGKTGAADLTPDQKNGWVPDTEQCPGAEWGKCLPAGTSVTQISFGGRRSFLHIGDFIQTMYKYAVGVAGILAAVMIIVAGLQWVTSGGNAEAITSAKHRISGAIIGVVIAYLSYAILNTLNPALVNLRLPQIWMIRPQALVPQFCSAVPTTTLFAFAVDSKVQDSVLPPPAATLNYDLTTDNSNKNSTWTDKTFYCGNRFYVKDGGATTCFGGYCEPEGDFAKNCANLPTSANQNVLSYQCSRGNISGLVINSSFLSGNIGGATAFSDTLWNDPPIWTSTFPNWTTANNLKMVCENGYVGDVGSFIEVTDVNKNTQRYNISVSNSELQRVVDVTFGGKLTHNTFIDNIYTGGVFHIIKNIANNLPNNCSGKVRGFVLQFSFNYTAAHLNSAEEHMIGKDGVDLGDKDFFQMFNAKMSDNYLIPVDRVQHGTSINVDAVNVTNMNSDRLFLTGVLDPKSSKHLKVYGYLIGAQ